MSSWTAGYAAAGDPEHAAAGHRGGCGELRQDQGRVPPQLMIEFFGLKVHKNENFFGSDLVIFTISLFVMLL